MNPSFQNTLDFARAADANDPLASFRDEFLLPRTSGKRSIYLCGNSLGLQPRDAKLLLDQQLNNWHDLAVEGWFEGDDPWMFYHKRLSELLAPIVGANAGEVIVMNSLSVNLHLLMVSFYRPQGKRYKILMEAGAFPSDQYITESQARFHGFDPADALIEVHPREGEELLRTEDIIAAIKLHGEELSLVLFSGINYYTGQLFDIEAITEASHQAGAVAGFDLAHAAGNVPLHLHQWNVDFACWCSYKYMNSGPGGIGGVFIHTRHFNSDLPRFAGWWGYREESRFNMEKGFVPIAGAAGWQLSCAPVLLLAVHKASLQIFERAGGMVPLREKSIRLTAYLRFIITALNTKMGRTCFNIITPEGTAASGCQLSLIALKNGKVIFDELVKRGVTGDWREPDVIRVSPVPLYNNFEDVYCLGQHLEDIVRQLTWD